RPPITGVPGAPALGGIRPALSGSGRAAARLDSEQFRSAPRTGRPAHCRLSMLVVRPLGGGRMFDLRRRDFVTLLGGGAAAWPLAARAQQRVTSPRRIGVLLVGLSPESKEAKQFRLGLRDAGYSEGRDVVIEWRSANGDYDRVPELVADLIRNRMDVIVQDSTIGTDVTKRATSTIPIVMALVLDPI